LNQNQRANRWRAQHGMYHRIDRDIERVLSVIGKDADHVRTYDSLLDRLNPEKVTTTDYQKEFARYWLMKAVRASQSFRDAYFQMLQTHLANRMTIADVLTQLSSIPTNRGGPKLQFSFATKLIHMADPHAPIFDSRVGAFYSFVWPASGLLRQRVRACLDFYEFLTREYASVLTNGLLDESIQAFEQRFNPRHFTREKVIDSLIWAFEAQR
jgi:hypothetical protein